MIKTEETGLVITKNKLELCDLLNNSLFITQKMLLISQFFLKNFILNEDSISGYFKKNKVKDWVFNSL